jgi:quercetin dioxygenase-like cupin family protein
MTLQNLVGISLERITPAKETITRLLEGAARQVSRLIMVALAAWPLVCSAHRADAVTPRGEIQERIYAGLTGVTVLENSRVLVQRFIIQPGQSTGVHYHSGNRLLVFVKGGVLRSMETGRSSLWPDGRVVWQGDHERADEGSTNTGAAPIELLWATIKPTAAAAAAPGQQAQYLSYPNVAGEDVLENDWVIVQRFQLKPGQWEGIHAHNPNTFYIFIRGAHWLTKSKESPQGVPGSAPDGLVAWMDPIDISDQHQSGNVGTTTGDVVWVALKQ